MPLERKGIDPVQHIIALRSARIRRQMLRGASELSRRELLRWGGRFAGAGATNRLWTANRATALAASLTEIPDATSIPESLKGNGEVVVVSWGGIYQDVLREAFFAPFQRLSGITVKEAEGPDVSLVKAMVDTGDVEWDLVELDRASAINLGRKGDYWEEIDYALFDTANIDEARRTPHTIDLMSIGQIFAYRTDVYPAAPQRWAHFWDTANFPGPRTLNGASGGLFPFLEAALIADGVAKNDVYPIDIERAFVSLSRVRDAVVKWWDAGAQPAQMLTDNEVSMAEIWSGRAADLKANGAPIDVVWDGGMFVTDVWTIPRGAPNRTNAQKLAAFSTLPEPQAHFSMLIPNGFVNNKAADLIPPERLELLASAPHIRSQMFDFNVEWWADNLDAVTAGWNEWILE